MEEVLGLIIILLAILFLAVLFGACMAIQAASEALQDDER